ncbi:MAG: DUF192 domain-containing protein [Proteobacteria bacterium]|nr:MAG: DUF192 domain-containing protein [Pseudomonadota bacterium]
MSPCRIVVASLIVGLLLGGSAHAQGTTQVTAQGRALAESFGRGEVAIRTTAGREERFDVFLAIDPVQRARGLMFVQALPDTVGMLFVHPHEHVVIMWMKNTPLPLDMLFVDKGGRIVHIARGTTPYSLGSISSLRPAIAVLEINAGLAERLGIQVGDQVLHQFFAAP